jgi:hypothetical protein
LANYLLGKIAPENSCLGHTGLLGAIVLKYHGRRLLLTGDFIVQTLVGLVQTFPLAGSAVLRNRLAGAPVRLGGYLLSCIPALAETALTQTGATGVKAGVQYLQSLVADIAAGNLHATVMAQGIGREVGAETGAATLSATYHPENAGCSQ